MKVLIFIDDEVEKSAVKSIENGIQTICKDFKFETTSSVDVFRSMLSVYKIYASKQAHKETHTPADLVWPAPSLIVKDRHVKEKVWSDIESRVVPAFKKVVNESKPVLTSQQLEKLLATIGDAKSPFKLSLSDGRVVGVNTDKDVDMSFSTGDIASMLAAILVFGAKGIVFD